MAFDSFVQVATDGAGKLIDMQSDVSVDPGSATSRPAAGTAVYRQRAVLVGQPAEDIQTLIALSQQQITLLKAIVALLGGTTNFSVNPDDYQ